MKKIIELYTTFLKVGGLTFGGGMAMLPMLKREVVEKRQWVTEEQILDIYAIGQCTPGVIAVNTSTYIGYQQGGILGAIAGTLGMVTPSLIIISLIATILNKYIHYPAVLHALSGIRIVVCAMMLNTVVAMIKSGVRDKLGAVVSLSVFLLATFSPLPTAVLVLMAALTGLAAKRLETRKQ